MGLDMYLTKKNYIGNEYRKPEEMVTVIVPENQGGALFPVKQPIKNERISEISERVGYWRKANHIHKWFVDNIQKGEDDCGEYEVAWDDLMKLLSDCKKVRDNKELAGEILPAQSGFFFGNTEYGECYFMEIDDTIKIIEGLIEEKGDDKYLSGDLYYSSSW